MDVAEVMTRLEALGSAQTKKTHLNHGAVEPLFGVKVGDLKPIVKKIKTNQPLASRLYATGNSDAMYLAGLIADPKTIGRDELERWAKTASWHMISEYTVAWVAAESPHGWDMGLRWIDASEPHVQSSGWATLACVVQMAPDDELDLPKLRQLLARVEKELHGAANRVRYTMNGFVISVGCYVTPLSETARKIGVALGKVEVNVGKTACKVPSAPEYIDKVAGMGRLGKKRKEVRC
ncbi:MAG: DNA alkylation repair protein [Thermoanaerobaculia bacterium]|nr:DNA alkylation repair protein [Thermoanaerobaculia bacterium]